MRKGRKNKTILLTMLVVAITSMTIVFAAMSTTLKIKGSGLLSSEAWNIKFENLASVTLKGTAEETTAPTIKSDTEIGDFSVVLKRTGDEVVYNFDIHNYGKLNAKIEELNIATPVCTGNAEDEAQKIADAQIVSESLTYTLTYSDGTEVKIGDTLKAEEVKSLTLKLAYTGENMPSDSVQITGLDVSIKHAQDMSTEEPELPVEPIDPATLAGKRFDKETKVMIDDKVVTIPSGATISALPGEYENVDDGLVMYVIPEGEEVTDWNADTDTNKILDVQENYDQFVWVPVENPVLDLSNNEEALSTDDNIKAAVQGEIDAGRYPMAIKKNENDYFGVLYDFSLDADTNSVKINFLDYWNPLGNEDLYYQKNREPGLHEASYNEPETQESIGITEEKAKSDYKLMVEKVKLNKGFWVGRYETSNVSSGKKYDSTQQVKIVKGAINGEVERASNNYWHRFYVQQKNYSNIVSMSSTTSYMIWGSQYDQIMIWMRNIENKSQNSYFILNSVQMGNYNKSGIDDGYPDTTNPAPTGCYKQKNIYDLAGNIWEWTCEVTSCYRVYRRR